MEFWGGMKFWCWCCILCVFVLFGLVFGWMELVVCVGLVVVFVFGVGRFCVVGFWVFWYLYWLILGFVCGLF